MLYGCVAVLIISALVYGLLALVERSPPARIPKWGPLALSVCFPLGALRMLQTTSNAQAYEPYALAGFVLGVALTGWRTLQLV